MHKCGTLLINTHLAARKRPRESGEMSGTPSVSSPETHSVEGILSSFCTLFDDCMASAQVSGDADPQDAGTQYFRKLEIQDELLVELFQPLATFPAAKADLAESDLILKEQKLYELWMDVSARIQSKLHPRVYIEVTTPHVVTRGRKHPVLACYAVGTKCFSDYRIEMLGALQDKVPAERHLEQLERSYAQRIFKAQPARSFLYAFVANHESVVFARFSRHDDDEKQFVRTRPLALSNEGGAVFLYLLQCSRDALGTHHPLSDFSLPGVGTIVPVRYLGHGASAQAYAALVETSEGDSENNKKKTLLTDRQVVVKCYHDTKSAVLAMQTERAFLERLAPMLAGEKNAHRIPSIVGGYNLIHGVY